MRGRLLAPLALLACSDPGPIMTIEKVSLYQAVEVRLVDRGARLAERNAPVVTNRPALVRVHAAADGPRGSTTATLRVTSAGRETVLVDGPKTLVPFADADLGSTFDFTLPAELVTPDLALSVELEGAVLPSLAVEPHAAPKLRVELVPVRYDADGSGRAPVIDEARYRDALYRLYPVSEVVLTRHAELPWSIPVEPGGAGWEGLLDAIIALRAKDVVDADVYYVGVVAPAPTARDHCENGCVLGVASPAALGPEIDTRLALRSAVVLGYQTSRSGDTLVQELGHAMGRPHAPCGNPGGLDPRYPYASGRIGTSGWDALTKELVDAAGRADVMSHCHPVWISDYTYREIFARMQKVAATAGQMREP